MILEWLLAAAVLIYCLLMLYLWLGWERVEITSTKEYLPSVSIIVPLRNEEATIGALLKGLDEQTYNGELEIIVVNDHSEDNTAIIASKFKHVKLLELVNNKGKKAALTYGIENSTAEIILTTDGDCEVGTHWVVTMVSCFTETTKLVSGPVGFVKQQGLFHAMQVIEFASLIGSGASLIGWRKPVMANGANLAFRRSAFVELGGYSGNEQTASGDDVFLLHKIAQAYPGTIAFAKKEEALVYTYSLKTPKAFWQQRKRWASKWGAYNDTSSQIIALMVFLISLTMAALPILVAAGALSLFTWLNMLLAKAFFDYFFLRQIVNFSGRRIHLIAFILLQVIHPFYVVLTALFSFGKTYAWKGRIVK